MNGQKVMGGERHEWAESEGRVEKDINGLKVTGGERHEWAESEGRVRKA